jgi:hypothetical protein
MTSSAQSRTLTLAETLATVETPPPPVLPGPRVEHLTLKSDGLLSALVSDTLQLPQPFIQSLLRFGAVYHCPVTPKPTEKNQHVFTPEQLTSIQNLRETAIQRHGRDPRLQHPSRLLGDITVTAGCYVRVHVHPKRFPAAHSVDWKQRIVYNGPELVAVDKPPGVQVGDWAWQKGRYGQTPKPLSS